MRWWSWLLGWWCFSWTGAGGRTWLHSISWLNPKKRLFGLPSQEVIILPQRPQHRQTTLNTQSPAHTTHRLHLVLVLRKPPGRLLLAPITIRRRRGASILLLLVLSTLTTATAAFIRTHRLTSLIQPRPRSTMKRFLTTTDPSSPDNKKHARLTVTSSSTTTTTSTDPSLVDSSADFLRVCSYNVDGLDDATLLNRASEVCSILLEQEPGGFLPDVILLQEMVPANVPVFLSRLVSAGYVVAPSSIPENDGYFTLAFFNGARIQITSSTRTPFPGSQMGRDLIKVQGRLALGAAGKPPSSTASSSYEFLFMTSHLESLGPSSAERSRQLKQVLDTLIAFPGPALFAGDTNLREGEVKAEPLYKEVVDAWVAGGSLAVEKQTWDMSLNDNLKMDGASFLPRMRLDRLLLNRKWGGLEAATTTTTAGMSKGNEGGKGKKQAVEKVKEGEELVKQWKLLGKGRMADGRFPSDHFGLSCLVRLPTGGGREGGAGEAKSN